MHDTIVNNETDRLFIWKKNTASLFGYRIKILAWVFTHPFGWSFTNFSIKKCVSPSIFFVPTSQNLRKKPYSGIRKNILLHSRRGIITLSDM